MYDAGKGSAYSSGPTEKNLNIRNTFIPRLNFKI